jgi:hypothetical protein
VGREAERRWAEWEEIVRQPARGDNKELAEQFLAETIRLDLKYLYKARYRYNFSGAEPRLSDERFSFLEHYGVAGNKYRLPAGEWLMLRATRQMAERLASGEWELNREIGEPSFKEFNAISQGEALQRPIDEQLAILVNKWESTHPGREFFKSGGGGRN